MQLLRVTSKLLQRLGGHQQPARRGGTLSGFVGDDSAAASGCRVAACCVAVGSR